MNYTEYIKDLLKPLGVYDLEEGAGAAEIRCLGNALDALDDVTGSLERESTVVTAEDFGLRMYEKLLSCAAPADVLSDRRAAVIGLLGIDDMSFTADELNNTLAGCGVNAKVRETETKYTVEVYFPDIRGIPENIELIKERILMILPCHLNVVYFYSYPTWRNVEMLGTWRNIEDAHMTWYDIEQYCPE